MGGKHVDDATEKRIVELYLNEGGKRLSAIKIIAKLQMENNIEGAHWVVPNSHHTVQKRTDKVKVLEKDKLGTNLQPWYMVQNEEHGIEFEDTPLLLRLLKLWFLQNMKTGDNIRLVPFSANLAKWAIRLHKAAPLLSDEELLVWAGRYSQDELFVMIENKHPNSFEDLEIAMKNEVDPEILAAYEKFLGPEEFSGPSLIPPETVTGQMVDGEMVYTITVPDDKLHLVFSEESSHEQKKRKGRRKKS